MSLQVDIVKKLKDMVVKVSFDTEKSCGITGFLGASGCGKSMTLKCIAGIEQPDKGRIVLNGRVLFDSEQKINVKVQERHVGYLFQSYALFPDMTVEENVAVALKYGRSTKTLQKEELQDRAQYFMRLLHVEGLSTRYPGQLSGGQQQRVALARILASDPAVLMLDEPFSALDYYLKERVQLELLEILDKYDKDILLVTHNRNEIYRLCQSMIVIDQGMQVSFGRTRDIFQNPITVAAARLTGCKNIEKIERIDDHQMYLSGWNVLLHVNNVIPKETTHIGIRAHDLRPAKNGEMENAVFCMKGRIMEDPFELVVIFEHNIWWKVQKEQWINEYKKQIPQRLWIPEESILYLRTNVGKEIPCYGQNKCKIYS